MVLPPLLKGVEGGKETERDRKTERGKKKRPYLLLLLVNFTCG